MVEALLFLIEPLFTCDGWLQLKLRYGPVGWVFSLSEYPENESHCLNLFPSELDGRPKLLRWLRKFCNPSGP
jgi:hypothetical protein